MFVTVFRGKIAIEDCMVSKIRKSKITIFRYTVSTHIDI